MSKLDTVLFEFYFVCQFDITKLLNIIVNKLIYHSCTFL